MINILVVEDNEKLNRIVCARLAEQGYRTIGCLKREQDKTIPILFITARDDIDSWTFTSPNCGTNSPPARILKSSPSTGWVTRRY